MTDHSTHAPDPETESAGSCADFPPEAPECVRHRVHPGVIGYAAFLIVSLVGVLAWPGVLLLRDMVVLDHPALDLAAVGLSDVAARNVPQDGFLAVVGWLVPASWVVRVLLVGSATIGAWGAVRLSSHSFSQIATVTVTVWNPFVVERLLQGHWSLVMVAWLIPALIATRARYRSQAALVWLCSLTPTGAIAALAVALVAGVHRWRVFFLGVWCCVPWLIPSMISPPQVSEASTVFVGRAETGVGTLGAFLSLGGLWNSEAIPPSRLSGFAIVGLAMTLAVAAVMPRRWLLLALGGTAVFVALWLGPAEWIFHHVPGAGLLRDSQKLVLAVLPGLITGVARIRSRHLAAIAAAAALLQVPDAPWALAALHPIAADPMWTQIARDGDGDLLDLDHHSMVVYHGRTVVNPLSKATSLVEPGLLVVDGVVVDELSPRYRRGEQAWMHGDHAELARLNITRVLRDGTVHHLDQPNNLSDTRSDHRLWWGVGLLGSWLLVPVALATSAIFAANKRPVSDQEKPAAFS